MENRTARRILFVAAMLGVPALSMGQEPVPAVRLVDPASIRAPQLTPAQLADLVAPVALYPDALLSQVLVASTYPLEVVQAQQWLQRNGRLAGQELMDAARLQPWDASVQGLVAFPDALSTLNQDIQWTTNLGNAFLAQEADVMVAVQELRARAQAAGRLSSTPQQTVSAVAQEGRTVIEIVPADPQVIYVPQYDPYYVWGAPAWGAYPPLAYGYGYGFGLGINVGFWFGGWSWGLGWGWGPNWYGGSVYVNHAFFRHCGYNYGHHGSYYGGPHGGHGGGGQGSGGHGGRETWNHDSGHRKGVPYGNSRGGGQARGGDQVRGGGQARGGGQVRDGGQSRGGDQARGGEADRGGSRASRSTMTSPGTLRRPGNLAASPTGDRTRSSASAYRGTGRDDGWRSGDGTTAPGSRGTSVERGSRGWDRPQASGSRSGGGDEGWRSGGRAIASAPRSGGGDRGWSASGEQRRSTPSLSQGRSPSPRSYSSSPRYSTSSPRSSGPSPGYSAPSRHSSPSTPSRGYQSAPRSPSSSGGGRSLGGGSAQRSGGGGVSRGSAGGRGSGGGSQGGGRRH